MKAIKLFIIMFLLSNSVCFAGASEDIYRGRLYREQLRRNYIKQQEQRAVNNERIRQDSFNYARDHKKRDNDCGDFGGLQRSVDAAQLRIDEIYRKKK